MIKRLMGLFSKGHTNETISQSGGNLIEATNDFSCKTKKWSDWMVLNGLFEKLDPTEALSYVSIKPLVRPNTDKERKSYADRCDHWLESLGYNVDEGDNMDIQETETEFKKNVIMMLDNIKENIFSGDYSPQESYLRSIPPHTVVVSELTEMQHQESYTFRLDFDVVKKNKATE